MPANEYISVPKGVCSITPSLSNLRGHLFLLTNLQFQLAELSGNGCHCPSNGGLWGLQSSAGVFPLPGLAGNAAGCQLEPDLNVAPLVGFLTTWRLTPEVGSEPGFLVFVTSAGKSGLQRSSPKTPPGSNRREQNPLPDTGRECGSRNTTSEKSHKMDLLDHRHVQS